MRPENFIKDDDMMQMMMTKVTLLVEEWKNLMMFVQQCINAENDYE